MIKIVRYLLLRRVEFIFVLDMFHKDNLYTVSWAGGLRKGENVSYDKKMVDHLIKQGGWLLHYTPEEHS